MIGVWERQNFKQTLSDKKLVATGPSSGNYSLGQDNCEKSNLNIMEFDWFLPASFHM